MLFALIILIQLNLTSICKLPDYLNTVLAKLKEFLYVPLQTLDLKS